MTLLVLFFCPKNLKKFKQTLFKQMSWRRSSGSQQNLNFYSNKLKSEPSGDYIDNIHANWYGSYGKLEVRHQRFGCPHLTVLKYIAH